MKWLPNTELQFLKGVGPKYASVLRKKGLYNFKDLIEYYPRAYQDFSENKKISELKADENTSLHLKVVTLKTQRIGRAKSITSLVLTDGENILEAKYFKSPYRGYFNQFEPGSEVRVSGKVKFFRNNFEMVHPNLSFLKQEEQGEKKKTQASTPSSKSSIQPIYPESEHLNQKKIKSLIHKAFELIESENKTLVSAENPWLYPFVPKEIATKYNLLDRWEAIKLLHYPDIEKDSLKNYSDMRSKAHLSLIFEELFVLELLTAIRQSYFKKEKGIKIQDDGFLHDFASSLPFELTSDQISTLKDIKSDFEQEHPMHRMVQGDVGSGKTLVALASAYLAIKNGHQVAIMAPTEILAQQHLKTAEKLLSHHGVKSLCVTGKLKESEKQEADQLISSGDADLVVGTHALFEDRIQFKSLGFVIIDEQHRFGVHQRQKLKRKGAHPHFLVMTATPIPRTLTMTVYGDLDVSLIQSLPPGRSPIDTKLLYQKERSKALDFVQNQVDDGRQAYFVFPLVSESESLDLKSAEFEFQELTRHFKDHNVGLLHGKMKPLEKDKIMEDFRCNRIQILVSTTVIEVGVDVPNATVMVIENSERFGLSQLHQLRGRVGRGQHKGQCFLILGNKFSKESLHRGKVMEQTTNGFEISEEDLKLRGPGEILGSRQSGLPSFKLANLLQHQKVLIAARKSAFEWVKNPKSQTHINYIKKTFRHKLQMGDVS